MTNILIIVTGSVAAIKLPILVKKLQQKRPANGNSFQIRIVLTEPSLHFLKLVEVENLLPACSIFRDADEWSKWRQMGDPVLHIELRNWADIGVIAPLDANTMGKISNGICDNLASCIIRAWDMNKQLLFAPAMNVYMWNHPITEKCIKVLKELGYIQIGPISKKLACGDYGMGAMAEVDQIITKIMEFVK
ncbi:phosphopantothenoylcysteine decarboxylase [Dermatophagoides pteronyssinus]|uniref:phosphopantothenoylcysteine decarboxylase n=1 Tax=Dermatophagoides pteronyssinus TaxID=6956 RepID=UPI003F673170